MRSLSWLQPASVASVALVVVALAAALVVPTLTSCDGEGSFDGGTGVDAGPIQPPGNEGIGAPCVYNRDGVNPDNQCPLGLSCLIFTSDGAFTSGMVLSAWEDQFTVFEENTDVGYCTLLGSPSAPPACPAGTTLKLLTQNVAACLRTCQTPADCGRDDYTCDIRYYDLLEGPQQPLCVRKCGFDLPDCVRSGILANPNNPQELIPTLAFQDLAGDSQCEIDGVCGFVATHGTAGPGEPCGRTEDCEAGSVCYQAPVLGAVLIGGGGVDPDGPGFCASPCNPAAPPDANPPPCTGGFVCQSVGNLNIGFTQPIVVNLENGALDVRGGFCFQQCTEGVEGFCDAVPGTACGQLDEVAVNDQWNNEPMCLPDALRDG